MGRPKKYENDAARVAAHRERNRRIDVSVTPDFDATIEKIAAYFEVSKSDVMNSLARSALTNADVYKTGLYQWRKRKP
jgi:hypothetical protein